MLRALLVTATPTAIATFWVELGMTYAVPSEFQTLSVAIVNVVDESTSLT